MDHPQYGMRPDLLLRGEGAAVLIAVCIAYGHLYAGKWGFFALLFLAPDASLLPYLWSRGAAAAAAYNIFHSYIAPGGLAMLAWLLGSPGRWSLGGEIALIWIAHIGFDRLLGYGLKHPGEFKRTHIQSSAQP